MAAADRTNPQRVKSSDSLYSLREFLAEFPDDDACLEWIWRERYAPDGEHAHCPKCQRERSFKRYATTQRRQAWTCTACGHHIHPTAGTIFAKSSRPLTDWFYAIYLVSSSRCGVAAKHLEREIGCNYKTAWRMLKQIRAYLMDQEADGPVGGIVEADETFIGGRIREGEKRRYGITRANQKGPYTKTRAVVVGAVERRGRIRASVVPSRSHTTQTIREFVLPGSMIFTDDWRGYPNLNREGYRHKRINHSEKVYVSGVVHTQTIEGFFGHFKNDLRGTHHSVSTKWLPTYLNEWVWKWNHRRDDSAMFWNLLIRAASPL